MLLTEGLKIADRFRLIRELGTGGMGSVWLAEHTGLEILCAVKLIDQRARGSTELRARFEREAKAAAQLSSRHVVRILDYGVWQDVPYIAMEYLEGEDLGARIVRLVRLSAGATFEIVSQVARALMRAHAATIVHRDLKPENIFLAREEDGEIAKVLDFGIATRPSLAISDTTTRPGSLMGTPFYMSPEQARGTKVDYRSDLWSLAVITFECITGEMPFVGEGLGDVIGKIIYEAMPVPSQVFPGVPRGFDEWWQRAAARDPALRFRSAQEFCDSLAVALGITQTFGFVQGSNLDQSLNDSGATPIVPLTAVSRGRAGALSESETIVAQRDSTTADPLMRTLLPFRPVPLWRRPLVYLAAVAALVGGVAIARFVVKGDAKPQAVDQATATLAAPRPAEPLPSKPSGESVEKPPPNANERSAVADNPAPASAEPQPPSAPETKTEAVHRDSVRAPRKSSDKPEKRAKTVDFGI